MMKQTESHTDHKETTMTKPLTQDRVQAADTTGWTTNKTLLALGAAGPVVFLVVSTLLGFFDPGFDVMTEPVSALAWGQLGWVQTANFYALGAATIAFALGLYRKLEGRGRMGAAILLSISGLALIVAGIFKGTPPGAEPTPSGLIHGMAFFWTFIPLPTAYALTALRLKVERGWGAHAVYSAAMPSVVFGLVVIYGVLGSDPGDPLFPIGGILNRVLIALAFGWVTITAARLLRNPRPLAQDLLKTSKRAVGSPHSPGKG
jgi:hypothetical membrane protein